MTESNTRVEVRTEHSPAPVGPYSQGIRAGELVFASGQIPLDPATGKKVEGEIEVEARSRCSRTSTAVLEAAGSGMDQRREGDGLSDGPEPLSAGKRRLRRSFRYRSRHPLG